MDDFGCPDCGSPALVYPNALQDDEPVACAGCGSFVSTFGELKQRAERVLDSDSTFPVSGC
jgi:ribosomal protein S27E